MTFLIYALKLDANQDIQTYCKSLNFRIRANPNVGETGYGKGINFAILRYSGADDIELISYLSSRVLPLNETDLLVVDVVDRFTVNGASFHPPPIPVLLRILIGAQFTDQLLPAGSVYALPPNSTIEPSVPGFSVGHAVLKSGTQPHELASQQFTEVLRSCSQKAAEIGQLQAVWPLVVEQYS
ncbi:hypothetical protein EDD18DRAFT_1326505 [Armillaria luteobubalina]|uniref:Uncharacterized protein n=1 Tax=Armillaria luteobubalina TaxID=153913 RepID=A0AA39QP73_9AGAR|nr:hypothetical protein EDD18DRAFT_1326505 [Armillaria luteobubalina]